MLQNRSTYHLYGLHIGGPNKLGALVKLLKYDFDLILTLKDPEQMQAQNSKSKLPMNTKWLKYTCPKTNNFFFFFFATNIQNYFKILYRELQKITGQKDNI